MSIFKSFGKSPAKVFAEGSYLIREGGRPGSLFVLESGEVEVLRGDTVVATIAEPGAILGEMSVLLAAPHSASVRARSSVFAHEVADAASALKRHPDLLYKVAQILARRLGATTTFLVETREQLADAADLEFLEKVYDLLGR